MSWYKLAQNNIDKIDIRTIRYILRLWVSGGWDDRETLLRLITKHKNILGKFKPSSPIRIWRNERISSDIGYAHNSGWENQYDYPTAWSMNKIEAEGYAKGPGRRLVTVISPPEDIVCSLPIVEHYVQKLGLKSIDIYNQSEIIVKSNPSFLNQIRPPVKSKEIPQLKEQLKKILFLHYWPELKENTKKSETEIKEIINRHVENLPHEELIEKIKIYQK